MSEFEEWFADQDFYTNMRFIHGDALFTKDGDVYRVLPVRIAFESWFASACTSIDHIHRLQHEKAKQQSEIDQLKVQISLQRDRNKALEAELTSSRNYGDQLNAEKAGLLKAIDDEVKRCVESANAPIRDDHDKGWRNAMLSVRDGFERLRGEHE